jgi:hypothetical protein
MELSENHIKYIETNLELYGIKSKALKEDLLDHICTYIESQSDGNFNTLYENALQKFGGYANFQNLQLETNLQKFGQKAIVLKRILHSVGALVAILITAGLMFKWLHWPFANIILLSGSMLLILIVIPVYFYDRYKSSIYKFS